MLFILLFTIFAEGIVADLYECQNQHIALDDVGFRIIDRRMTPEQECTLTFTWPDQYIAVVRVKATLTYSENIFVFSNWGQTIEKAEANLMASTSAWPPNNVSVTIRTVENSQMVLTLLVERQKFSVPNCITETLETAPNQQPFYIDTQNWKPFTGIAIESKTQVAISKAEPENTDARDWANVFVYDRIGSDIVFRGTLYSLDKNDENIISKTNGFTLYLAYPSFNLRGTIVANDKENVNFLSHAYTAWEPDQTEADQTYFLDASQGMAALTILSESGRNGIYVTKIEYMSEDASPIDLLAGGCVKDPLDSKTKLAGYNESILNLPQYVPGRARTFILSEGMATVSYTTLAPHENNEAATNGRTGFIVSNNYPFISNDQDSSEFVLKSENGDPFTLLLDFPYKNLNKDSYLNISLKGEPGMANSEQKTIIQSLFDLPEQMNATYTVNEISIRIYGGKEESNGTFIEFAISYPEATTTELVASTVQISSTVQMSSTTFTTVIAQFPETTLVPICDQNFTAAVNSNMLSRNYEDELCILRIDTTKGFIFVNFTGTSKDAKLTIIDLNTASVLQRPSNNVLESSTTSLKIEIDAINDDVFFKMTYKYIDPCMNYCGADTVCNVNAAGHPYCNCLHPCDQPNADGVSCSPSQCSKVFKSKNCDPVQNGCMVVAVDGECTPVCKNPKPPLYFKL